MTTDYTDEEREFLDRAALAALTGLLAGSPVGWSHSFQSVRCHAYTAFDAAEGLLAERRERLAKDGAR